MAPHKIQTRLNREREREETGGGGGAHWGGMTHPANPDHGVSVFLSHVHCSEQTPSGQMECYREVGGGGKGLLSCGGMGYS